MGGGLLRRTGQGPLACVMGTAGGAIPAIRDKYARGRGGEIGRKIRARFQASAVNQQIIGTGGVAFSALVDGPGVGAGSLPDSLSRGVDMCHGAVGRIGRGGAPIRRRGGGRESQTGHAQLSGADARELYRVMGHELPAGRSSSWAAPTWRY